MAFENYLKEARKDELILLEQQKKVLNKIDRKIKKLFEKQKTGKLTFADANRLKRLRRLFDSIRLDFILWQKRSGARLKRGLGKLVVKTFSRMLKDTNRLFRTSIKLPKLSDAKIKSILRAPRTGLDVFETIRKNVDISWFDLKRSIQGPLVQAGDEGLNYTQMISNIKKSLKKSLNSQLRVMKADGNGIITDSKDIIFEAFNSPKTEAGKAVVNTRQGPRQIAGNIEKYWIHDKPKVPRITHLQADGKAADEEGMFHIAGEVVKGPGHFSGPENNANCLCSVGIRWKAA